MYHRYRPFQIITSILLLGFVVNFAQAFQGIAGLYCGLKSCYDVLGANRESTKDEIVKLYRNLAKQWHPDKFHDEEKKAEATERFREIATAHEVLVTDESRKEYNDMLDDPESYYRHYYRYYRRFGAKVDATRVIVGLITIISLCQYFYMHYKYRKAIDDMLVIPTNRFKAQVVAKEKGLLPISSKRSSRDASGAKRNRHKSKEELKEEEEAILRQVIADIVDIRGGRTKPDMKNLFCIQLFVYPCKYIFWYLRWVYLFDFKKEPYGDDEKVYLISKFLGVREDLLHTNEDLDSLLRQELWIKEKFVAWKKKKDEEAREKLAEKPGYKRYRRYMKKGGPGQISFLED